MKSLSHVFFIGLVFILGAVGCGSMEQTAEEILDEVEDVVEEVDSSDNPPATAQQLVEDVRQGICTFVTSESAEADVMAALASVEALITELLASEDLDAALEGYAEEARALLEQLISSDNLTETLSSMVDEIDLLLCDGESEDLLGDRESEADESVYWRFVEHDLPCNLAAFRCGADSSFTRPSCDPGDVQLEAIIPQVATGISGIVTVDDTSIVVHISDGYVPNPETTEHVRIMAICADTTR